MYSQLSLNGHLYKMDTSLRRTPCVGPGRFLVILPVIKLPLRRTTETLKPSTDTCEVVFSVKNTSNRNACVGNDSKLRITETKTKHVENS